MWKSHYLSSKSVESIEPLLRCESDRPDATLWFRYRTCGVLISPVAEPSSADAPRFDSMSTACDTGLNDFDWFCFGNVSEFDEHSGVLVLVPKSGIAPFAFEYALTDEDEHAGELSVSSYTPGVADVELELESTLKLRDLLEDRIRENFPEPDSSSSKLTMCATFFFFFSFFFVITFPSMKQLT